MAVYLLACDISAAYGVSLRTVRRWAAQDRWRRQPGRPVRYSLADADRSYHKRHDKTRSLLAQRLTQ